jgi:hypothetical protein
MALLDYKSKFDTQRRFIPTSPGTKAPLQIKESVFVKWGNVNMYRTSYNDMSNRVSALNIHRRTLSLLSHSYCSSWNLMHAYIGYPSG